MGESQTNPVIKTSDLSVGYGQNALFKNLELTLDRGKLVCFMGPNGSGKSTLIRSLGGLQKILSGSVNYLSETGAPIQKHIHKHLALVLTDVVHAANMSVYELITFGRYPYLDWSIRLKKKDRDIISHAIEQVNIGHLQDKKLNQLSDGQLQMAMIARALAQDTSAIILDEPTAHLDLNNRVEIMRLLRILAHENGKSILLATHELDLALQTADEIWLTGNQQNIITGIPEDLVLDGTFDEIFRFKGFDLKTGKVQHIPFRKRSITLQGEDYTYLWTKNALERNGFDVVSSPSELNVEIIRTEIGLQWKMNSVNFPTLRELLLSLTNLKS